ncbi:B3 domain-containing protein Os04g0386900-like [Aristolochia californica]|uniref:B3 domain-containing protein Os04g0386900-like n=1 Tax=Aristolochia californica TaxID=171875 RepID=UPI0035DBC252
MASNVAPMEEDIVPLTGKPYFSFIIAKSHIGPYYNLELPLRGRCWFPTSEIPITLFRGTKTWKGYYYGDRKFKKFDPSWKDFVRDNKLEVGDACLFELMDVEKGEIKVQILRADIEIENLGLIGNSSANPIQLE